MTSRKVLVALLIAVAASPVWGGAEPLGSVASSSATTVRDSKLTSGSTVFSGDVVSVGAHGMTRIALSGGALAEILANSSVRLVKTDGKIQMIVDRGQASFHTSGGNGMSALVADATVRPVGDSETSVVIQSLSETHAVIAAEKGALLVTTAHDAKTYTLAEGEAVDLSAAPDPQGPAGASHPAGKVSTIAAHWRVVVIAAGVALTTFMVVRVETNQQNPPKEISPHM